ncbi:MAG: PQQ-binding-like beta-propeller repeat protein [Planctomycetes bacterium]|nr:PQQ-binding-like beta-propeller repeat protein [Planctomycetota bacterium]
MKSNPGAAMMQLLAVIIAVCSSLSFAAENEKASVEERSLALRTALHGDASLTAPLEHLVKLYRENNRLPELIQMYRGHLAQYPGDMGARIVLIRILAATGNTDALDMARDAVKQFPDSPYLNYLLYTLLKKSHDPAYLEILDHAVKLETNQTRKKNWLEELLPEAIHMDRADMAEAHLKSLLEAGAGAEECVEVARKMLKYGMNSLAIKALEKAASLNPQPEVSVEIELIEAKARALSGEKEKAEAILDGLLGKVTVDYWRRDEILRQRVALATTGEEREAILAGARAKAAENPQDEVAIIDLARIQAAFEFRRDALNTLLEGSKRLPDSVRIEAAVLEMYDRLRDEAGREKFLADRIKAMPDRSDLVLAHVKTLFILGRKDEAFGEFKKMTVALAEGDRLAQKLELARFLRRSNLSSEAVVLFEELAKDNPQMLSVRRELAEIYVVLGDKQRARKLFSEGMPEDAPIENLFDAVQFMIEQELYLEARNVLLARAEIEKTNIELRMLLVDISRRLGDFRDGEKFINEARALTDTSARYRLWLEGATAFYETFEGLDKFFEEERARVETERGEGWDETKIERMLIFAEAMTQDGDRDLIMGMIGTELEADPPAKIRAVLRRKLIAIAGKGMGGDDIVETQLIELAKDDPSALNEVNARLAVIYFRRNQYDMYQKLLEQIDPETLNDPALLTELGNLYKNAGRLDLYKKMLGRITELDPTNRNNWEAWIGTLAASGDEDKFRMVLRKLIAGVDRMPLADDTIDLLRNQLCESYWRSIAAKMAQGDKLALGEALSLVDGAERCVGTFEDALWVVYVRASLLSGLGREKACSESVEEFMSLSDRVVVEKLKAASAAEEEDNDEDVEEADAADETDNARPGDPDIDFPDGFTMKMSAVRKNITELSRTLYPRPSMENKAPVPPYRVKWAFDTINGANITSFCEIGDGKLLVSDAGGTVYCVDSKTGKLLWQRDNCVDRQASANAAMNGSTYYRGGRVYHRRRISYNQSFSQNMSVSCPASDGAGRVIISRGGEVECISTANGATIWKTEMADSAVAAPNPAYSGQPVAMSRSEAFINGDSVVVFNSAAESSVSSFSLETGKLLWTTSLPGFVDMNNQGKMTGAELDGNDLLVFGGNKVVDVDVRSGDILWQVDPNRQSSLPLKLKEASSVNMPGVPALSSLPVMGGVFGGVRSRGYYSQGNAYVNYLSDRSNNWQAANIMRGGSVILSSPLTVWTNEWGRKRVCLYRDNILLLGQSSTYVMSRRLPLIGKQVSVSGTFLGIAGNRACFLNNSTVVLVDLKSLSVSSVSVNESVPTPNTLAHGCTDGLLAYVAGEGGITCINARTSQIAFFAPWPEALTGGEGEGETDDGEAASEPGPAPNGYLSGVQIDMPGGGGGISNVSYVPDGMMINLYQGGSSFVPMVAGVGDGVLYVNFDSNTLVALVSGEKFIIPGIMDMR